MVHYNFVFPFVFIIISIKFNLFSIYTLYCLCIYRYSTKQLSKYKLECYVYSPTEKKWISRTFQTKPFADTKRKSKGASQGIDVFNNENTPSKQRYYLYDEHGNYYTFQTHSILLQLKDAFVCLSFRFYL